MLHSLVRAVIAVLHTPTRRIGFALVLSVLIHAVILWLPYIHLPHERVQLPPLTVRLELMPKPEAVVEAVSDFATQLEFATNEINPGGIPSGKSAIKSAVTMKKMERSSALREFPKRVQLSFAIYKGAELFRVGEVKHQLEIHNDSYTLKSSKHIGGLSSLLNIEQFSQISHGKLGEQGLKPKIYKEEKISAVAKQSLKVIFDWAEKKVRFEQGGDVALPEDAQNAQDALSFMYQLSLISMQQEIIPLSISDGVHLEKLEIEIGSTEDIATPMGKLSAKRLRKIHAPGEAYFEIWLGLEYRLLPVKFSQFDGSGALIEEFVISDIRAADE